jgi:hypothetical protein
VDGTIAAGQEYLSARCERLMPEMMTQAQYEAYIEGQLALGRDVSEYRPDIREKHAAAREVRRQGRRRSARGQHDGEDLFGGHFDSAKLPPWRRWWYRLLGYDL